jgi:O-antigen/teichoic acid export membrane protein
LSERQSLFSLISSGVIAQSLLLLGNLLFARLYSPEAFGILGVYTVFASLAVVSGLRFDYLVFSRPAYERQAYLVIGLISALAINALLYLVLTISNVFMHNHVDSIVWAITICITASLYYLASQHHIASGEYGIYNNFRIIQAVIYIGLAIGLFALDEGMLIAFAGSQALVGLYLLWRIRREILTTSYSLILACWQRDRNQAVSNSFITLIQYSTPFSPILIATYIFSKEDVGAYFLFSSAISAPLAIYRRSAINFISAEAAIPIKANALKNKLMPKSVVIISVSILILLMCVVLHIWRNEIIQIIFGTQWSHYELLLAPTVAYFILDAWFQPFTALLPLWGRQSYAFYLEVSRFTLVFIFLPFISIKFSLTFNQFIYLYFVLMLVVYVAMYIITLNILKVASRY